MINSQIKHKNSHAALQRGVKVAGLDSGFLTAETQRAKGESAVSDGRLHLTNKEQDKRQASCHH